MKNRVILPEIEIRLGESKSKEEREAVVMKAVSIAAQIKRKGKE